MNSPPRRRPPGSSPYRRRGSMSSSSPLCSSPSELVHEQPATSPAAGIITLAAVARRHEQPMPPRCICSRMPLALQHVNPRSSFCTSLEVTRDASAHASELVSHSAMHDYVHHKRSKLKGTRCIHVKMTMTFDYFCRRDFPAEPLRPRQAAATSTQAQLTRPCTDYSPLLQLQRRSRPTRPDDTAGCC